MPMMSTKDAYEQAKALHDQGSYRTALRSAEVLYKQSPFHPPIVALYVSCLVRVQYSDQAIRIAKRSLRNVSNKPHRVMILASMCDGMTQSGSLEEAIGLVEDELERQPLNSQLAGTLCHMLVLKGDKERVNSIFDEFKQAGVESLHLASHFGRTYLRIERRDEAIEYLQTLLAKDEEGLTNQQHFAYNILGQLLDKAGRYDEAFESRDSRAVGRNQGATE